MDPVHDPEKYNSQRTPSRMSTIPNSTIPNGHNTEWTQYRMDTIPNGYHTDGHHTEWTRSQMNNTEWTQSRKNECPGWCSFGIVPIRDGVHSGLCPFGMVLFRLSGLCHSGWCPFGMVSIWDGVHSGLSLSGSCPFGQLSGYQFPDAYRIIVIFFIKPDVRKTLNNG